MNPYRVYIESTYHFPSDESEIYIGKRREDGFYFLKFPTVMWEGPTDTDTSVAQPESDRQPSLIIQNELGKALMEALIRRYGAPEPEIDWETHYREAAAQRDHWKDLYLAVRGEMGNAPSDSDR